MARFSKLILTVATYSVIISLVSLIIGFLNKEDSPAQAIFYGITLDGTIITIYALLFHLLIVFLAFIIKFSKLILTIATYSFIVSLISLIIGFLSKEDSTVQSISSGITLYGTIITIYLLLFHLLGVFISFIIKNINKQDNS